MHMMPVSTLKTGCLSLTNHNHASTTTRLRLKKRPPLTCYNLYIHGSIATIFGKNVAEKVGNQKVLYFLNS